MYTTTSNNKHNLNQKNKIKQLEKKIKKKFNSFSERLIRQQYCI